MFDKVVELQKLGIDLDHPLLTFNFIMKTIQGPKDKAGELDKKLKEAIEPLENLKNPQDTQEDVFFHMYYDNVVSYLEQARIRMTKIVNAAN